MKKKPNINNLSIYQIFWRLFLIFPIFFLDSRNQTLLKIYLIILSLGTLVAIWKIIKPFYIEFQTNRTQAKSKFYHKIQHWYSTTKNKLQRGSYSITQQLIALPSTIQKKITQNKTHFLYCLIILIFTFIYQYYHTLSRPFDFDSTSYFKKIIEDSPTAVFFGKIGFLWPTQLLYKITQIKPISFYHLLITINLFGSAIFAVLVYILMLLNRFDKHICLLIAFSFSLSNSFISISGTTAPDLLMWISLFISFILLHLYFNSNRFSYLIFSGLFFGYSILTREQAAFFVFYFFIFFWQHNKKINRHFVIFCFISFFFTFLGYLLAAYRVGMILYHQEILFTFTKTSLITENNNWIYKLFTIQNKLFATYQSGGIFLMYFITIILNLHLYRKKLFSSYIWLTSIGLVISTFVPIMILNSDNLDCRYFIGINLVLSISLIFFLTQFIYQRKLLYFTIIIISIYPISVNYRTMVLLEKKISHFDYLANSIIAHCPTKNTECYILLASNDEITALNFISAKMNKPYIRYIKMSQKLITDPIKKITEKYNQNEITILFDSRSVKKSYKNNVDLLFKKYNFKEIEKGVYLLTRPKTCFAPALVPSTT